MAGPCPPREVVGLQCTLSVVFGVVPRCIGDDGSVSPSYAVVTHLRIRTVVYSYWPVTIDCLHIQGVNNKGGPCLT